MYWHPSQLRSSTVSYGLINSLEHFNHNLPLSTDFDSRVSCIFQTTQSLQQLNQSQLTSVISICICCSSCWCANQFSLSIISPSVMREDFIKVSIDLILSRPYLINCVVHMDTFIILSRTHGYACRSRQADMRSTHGMSQVSQPSLIGQHVEMRQCRHRSGSI